MATEKEKAGASGAGGSGSTGAPGGAGGAGSGSGGAGSDAPTQPVVNTVNMWRVQPPEGGPTTAAVHPDEVQNYARAGWQKGEPPKDEAAKGE